MSPSPSATPNASPRLVVPALVVALAAVAVLVAVARSGSGTTPAQGDFWSAHDRLGQLLELSAATPSLPLRPGDELRLQPDDATRRLSRIDLRAQRHGQQSSYIDLRLREQAGQALLLRILPGETVLAYLSTQADGAGGSLAQVELPGLLPDPDAAFDIGVSLEGNWLHVTINDQRLLSAEHSGPASGAALVKADGLLVEQLRVAHDRLRSDGTVASRQANAVDMAAFTAMPLGQALGRGLLGLAGVLAVVAGWLATLARSRPSGPRLARATLQFLAPPAALILIASLQPATLGRLLPFGLPPLVLLGLVLARPTLASAPARPARRRRDGSRQALVTAVLVGSTAWIATQAAAEALAPDLARVTDSLERLAPRPFERRRPLTLERGTTLVVPGPYRSFDLTTQVSLQPGSLLEVRLRNPKVIANGVALILSSDPRVETGFVVQSSIALRPIGTGGAAVSAGEHSLRLVAHGDQLTAELDGDVVARASDWTAPAEGAVILLAPVGAVEIRDVALQPSSAEPPPPDALAARRHVGLRFGLGFVVLALLTAWLLRRPVGATLEGLSFACLPLAWTLTQAERVGPLTYAAFLGSVLACAALGWIHVVARGRGAGLVRTATAVLLVLLATAAAPVLAVGAPRRSGYAASPAAHDVELPRLLPGLLHFQHPQIRRHNAWLRDHRFRKRAVSVAKPADTTRILCLGSSSTWGHGIPLSSTDDYPALLGQKLQAALPAQDIEVVNAAIPGTTSARMLILFEEVLLGYAPDIVTLSFGFNDATALTLCDEALAYERLATDPAPHGWLDRLAGDRALTLGRERLARLSTAFASVGDTVAAWEEVVDDDELRRPDRIFASTLRRFASLCAERGIDLVLIKEPVEGDLDRLWKTEFFAAMDQVAGEHGLTVVDPAPVLAASDERLFMDLVHPLPAGNAIVADSLLPALRAHVERRAATADDPPR